MERNQQFHSFAGAHYAQLDTNEREKVSAAFGHEACRESAQARAVHCATAGDRATPSRAGPWNGISKLPPPDNCTRVLILRMISIE